MSDRKPDGSRGAAIGTMINASANVAMIFATVAKELFDLVPPELANEATEMLMAATDEARAHVLQILDAGAELGFTEHHLDIWLKDVQDEGG